VPRLSKDVLYRLRYADWKDYEMTVNWNNRLRPLPVYIASVCDFTLDKDAPNVVYYKSCRMGATTITAEEVNAWATNVDEEGFLYIRMNPQGAGKATFTTTKPAEEDPEIITNECVEGSIKLNVGNQLTLNLNNAFTVYCINYAEWAAQGATLQWTGEEPLHTFVAETCQFAVAPYNKFVHLYLPIIAETALDMNALAPYVDDAGYLYIRFLTEKEGVLTIK
jgi:hypothetical protein